MLGSSSVLSFTASLLAAVATAQTAPGFPIQASQQLSVAFGNNTVSPSGERIPRGETAQPPSISTPVWPETSNGSAPQYGVLLMVDIDVPLNTTRVQLLHWLASNISIPTTSLSPSTNTNTNTPLTIPSLNPIPYIQPSPPVGDVPHAYTLLLFAQPPDFSIPAQYANLSDNRVPFNVTRFVSDAGLADALAANWFTVQNLTGTPVATTYPAARPTATQGGNGTGSGSGSGNGTGVFQGAAAAEGRVGGLLGWAGLVGVLVGGGLGL